MENEIGLGKLINLLGSFSMILKLMAFAAEEAPPQGCNEKKWHCWFQRNKKKAVPKKFLLDSPYWFGEREEHASI
jgi:hypothetical protein